MKDEMHSMYQNQTWELVTPPEGRKVVDCRWVYKIKQVYDNIPPRYKARLCARGFSQVYGLDFEETYAPVVEFTSVRIFLVKAILMKMKIHQMDVVTAFLYAPIDEEIYMKQAPALKSPERRDSSELNPNPNPWLLRQKRRSNRWKKFHIATRSDL
jgi:hypothetical protein